MIAIAKQVLTKETINELLNRLSNDRWVLGEVVGEFEEAFARYVGVDYAVALSNGTMALLAAYEALGIRKKVLVTTPYTFVATSATASFLGTRVEFVDIQPEDANIDPMKTVETVKKLGENVVITSVHIFGYPARVDILKEEFGDRIPIVEDCAQAHGAVLKGRKVGSIGDVGVFSFYPSKNMTVAGDGGMLVTNDEHIYKYVLMLRDNGRISRYVHIMPGLNLRLNTINAAIGLVQLRYLDKWNDARKRNAKIYYKKLRNLTEYLELGSMPKNDWIPVYNTYPIRVRNPSHRGTLGVWLKEHDVHVAIFYPIPLHKQPLYRDIHGNRNYPVAEDYSRRVLNLPCHQFLEEREVSYVVSLIKEFYEEEIYRREEWMRKGIKWENSMR